MVSKCGYVNISDYIAIRTFDFLRSISTKEMNLNARLINTCRTFIISPKESLCSKKNKALLLKHRI